MFSTSTWNVIARGSFKLRLLIEFQSFISMRWPPQATSYFKISLWRKSNGLHLKTFVGRRSNGAHKKTHVGQHLLVERKRRRWCARYVAKKTEKSGYCVKISMWFYGWSALPAPRITGWNKWALLSNANFFTSKNCLTTLVNFCKEDRCLHVALRLRNFSKCLLNLSTWEQSLLPVLDVFGMGWVIKRPSQGAAAEMLPKTYHPTYSSWTLKGLLQTRSLSLSS